LTTGGAGILAATGFGPVPGVIVAAGVAIVLGILLLIRTRAMQRRQQTASSTDGPELSRTVEWRR